MRITNRLLLVFTITCFAIGAFLLWKGHSERNPARYPNAPESSPPFRMSDRIATLRTETNSEGKPEFVFEAKDGEIRLTPQEFADTITALQARKEHGGMLFRILDITSTSGLLWVILGFIGQLLFTGRMLVQWVASERAKQSIVPPAFWWLSLLGSSMLIIYFWWRVDIVGILGQATGWFVYVRNILLLRKAREAAAAIAKDTNNA